MDVPSLGIPTHLVSEYIGIGETAAAAYITHGKCQIRRDTICRVHILYKWFLACAILDFGLCDRTYNAKLTSPPHVELAANQTTRRRYLVFSVTRGSCLSQLGIGLFLSRVIVHNVADALIEAD